jgi:16S rRNA processing protein RimM
VGLAGECVIHPVSPDAADLDRVFEAPVHLTPPEGEPASVAPGRWESLRWQGKRPVAHFEGIDTREAIAKHTHWNIWIDATGIPDPDEPDTWWAEDLVGCTVLQRSEAADGIVEQVVGEVTDTVKGRAHDYLVVKQTGGKEVHLPFLRASLLEVDLEARRIALDLPEGLLDD